MKNLSTSQKIAVLVFRCINLIRVWSWLQNWGKLNYMDIRKSTNKKSMAWEKTNQKRKEWYLILTRITSKLLLNNDMNWLNTHKNKSPWFKLVMTQVKYIQYISLNLISCSGRDDHHPLLDMITHDTFRFFLLVHYFWVCLT